MKKFISIAILIIVSFHYSFSQQIEDTLFTGRKPALKIFLDCNDCDLDYFRTNFTIVNYVNDNKDADVHILVTSLPTGSGGSAYSIILLGQGRYKYMIDTVIFNMSQDITAEVARIVLLNRIQ